MKNFNVKRDSSNMASRVLWVTAAWFTSGSITVVKTLLGFADTLLGHRKPTNQQQSSKQAATNLELRIFHSSRECVCWPPSAS